MSYEILDVVADLFNPVWCFLAVGLTLQKSNQQWCNANSSIVKTNLHLFARLAAYNMWVFSWMLIDNRVEVWPAIGADYSTHTGVAIALIWYIDKYLAHGWRYGLWLSLMAYCSLMLYQGYHSVFDMVTTGALITAGLTIIDAVSHRLKFKA